MAHANRKQTIEYTLSLNEAEVSALIQVFNNIGGDPSTTRRGLIDSVRSALINAGAPLGAYSGDPDHDTNGEITFLLT